MTEDTIPQQSRGSRVLHTHAVALLDRSLPRPLLGTGTFAASLAITLLAWSIERPALPSGWDAVLLIVLMAAVTASSWLRVQVGKSTVVYFASIPLYLLCCLFLPPLAATATGASMLARELINCRRCAGNSGGVIAAQVGRWMLLSGVVSAIVHLFPADYILYAGALAAVLLWIGDVGTAPVVFSPVTGQAPARVIVLAARQSYAGELMQYLIALFTLALLRADILWIDMVYVPLIILSVLLLYLYLKSVDDGRQPAEADR